MNTKESLGIFWTFEKLDNSNKTINYQDEVDGLIFYGFWENGLPEKSLALDSFSEIWRRADIRTKLRKWNEENYRVYSIEVYIKTWPEESSWRECIKSSLMWFQGQGALVAWCGGEDSSPSIDVFNPELASGNVYAASAANVGFLCNASLNDEHQELQDEQLLKFWDVLQS